MGLVGGDAVAGQPVPARRRPAPPSSLWNVYWSTRMLQRVSATSTGSCRSRRPLCAPVPARRPCPGQRPSRRPAAPRAGRCPDRCRGELRQEVTGRHAVGQARGHRRPDQIRDVNVASVELMIVRYAGRAGNQGARNNRRDRVSTPMHPRKVAPAASTRSDESSCAPRSRCCAPPTPRTAPPSTLSSSTRPPASPSVRA
jgi:hypothetical protein